MGQTSILTKLNSYDNIVRSRISKEDIDDIVATTLFKYTYKLS